VGSNSTAIPTLGSYRHRPKGGVSSTAVQKVTLRESATIPGWCAIEGKGSGLFIVVDVRSRKTTSVLDQPGDSWGGEYRKTGYAPLRVEDGKIEAQVLVADISVLATVDSGTTRSFIHETLLRQLNASVTVREVCTGIRSDGTSVSIIGMVVTNINLG